MSKRKPSDIDKPIGMAMLQYLRHIVTHASESELAKLLGIVVEDRVAKLGERPKPILPFFVGKPVTSRATRSEAAYPPETISTRFLYHSKTQWKPERESSHDLPDWYHSTVPFEGEVESPIAKRLPDPQMLCSWQKIWPALHALLQDRKQINRINVSKLVDYAVRQKPITELPWRNKLRWPEEIVLLIDTSLHLSPYIRDYESVARQLIKWFRSRVKLVVCTDSEHQTYEYRGKRYDEFPRELCNTRVLYLGDLGFLDQQGISAALWSELSTRLAKRGVSVHALLTVSSADIRWGGDACFNLYSWSDHGIRRVSAELGGTDVSLESAAQVDALLGYLSLAIQVTPALIRQMRTVLGYRVSVESLIMQHPALEGHAVFFHWRDAKTQDKHRRKLNAIPGAEETAWRVIQQFEACLPVELQAEQRQKRGKSLSPDQLEFVRRLIKTGIQQKNHANTDSLLMDWVGRMAGRSGNEVWQEETQALFALYQDYINSKQRSSAVPNGVDSTRLPQWVTQSTPMLTPVKLRLVGEKRLVVADASAEPEGIEIATCLWSEGTTVRVYENGFGAKQPLSSGGSVSLPAACSGIELDTADYVLTFSPVTCPSWASGMGRDRYGLFVEVEVNKVQFIMRWIPPGEFMMGPPEDEIDRHDESIRDFYKGAATNRRLRWPST